MLPNREISKKSINLFHLTLSLPVVVVQAKRAPLVFDVVIIVQAPLVSVVVIDVQAPLVSIRTFKNSKCVSIFDLCSNAFCTKRCK